MRSKNVWAFRPSDWLRHLMSAPTPTQMTRLTCSTSERNTPASGTKFHLFYLQLLLILTILEICTKHFLHYKLQVLALCSNEPHLLHLLGAFIRASLGCSVDNAGLIFSALSSACSLTTRF